jgi:hypothetical protein
MGRNYIKKRKQPLYNSNDLKDAVLTVKQEVLTVYVAAKQYNTPRMTLRHHLDDNIQKVGKVPIFNDEQEKCIADRVIYLGGRGFPLTVGRMCEMTYRYGMKLQRRKKLLRDIPQNLTTKENVSKDFIDQTNDITHHINIILFKFSIVKGFWCAGHLFLKPKPAVQAFVN